MTAGCARRFSGSQPIAGEGPRPAKESSDVQVTDRARAPWTSRTSVGSRSDGRRLTHVREPDGQVLDPRDEVRAKA